MPHRNGRDGVEAPSNTLSLGLIDVDQLRPLISEIVELTLERLDQARATLPADRLAYSEAEAAALLGLEQHVLRDERLRGRIQASQVVGRRIRYTREDLISYLSGRRFAA
jgi:hypothetical protein